MERVSEPNEILFLETLTQPYLSELGYGGMRSGYPEAFDSTFKSFTQDEYIGSKLETYIKTGLGAEGYRSDPWMTEMKIVFPEKFEKVIKDKLSKIMESSSLYGLPEQVKFAKSA